MLLLSGGDRHVVLKSQHFHTRVNTGVIPVFIQCKWDKGWDPKSCNGDCGDDQPQSTEAYLRVHARLVLGSSLPQHYSISSLWNIPSTHRSTTFHSTCLCTKSILTFLVLWFHPYQLWVTWPSIIRVHVVVLMVGRSKPLQIHSSLWVCVCGHVRARAFYGWTFVKWSRCCWGDPSMKPPSHLSWLKHFPATWRLDCKLHQVEAESELIWP